jgi:hypothetical protein
MNNQEILKGYELTDTKINLCDTCRNEFPTCEAKNVDFGNGKGDDNVYRCDSHEAHRHKCLICNKGASADLLCCSIECFRELDKGA